MTPRAWLLFALSSVIWGVPYFFIKVAVDAGVPPAFVAWARVALGAVLLLPVALRRGALRGLGGRERAWPIAAYAACEIAVPFVLISVGEQYISSSLTAILIATMPLLVALLSVRFSPADKPTGLRVVGLVVGLGGVVAVLGLDVAGRPAELLGAALVLVATLGYAAAPIIVSKHLADIALLPAALARPPHGIPGSAALLALLVLGVVCTALGLVVFFQLIAEAGPNRASLITYVNPLVAVAVGVVALHEHVGAATLTGLLLILVGSWLAAGGRVEQHA